MPHMCSSPCLTCAPPHASHVLLPMPHMCSSPCLTCAPPHASHVLLPMPHMCSSPCLTCAPPHASHVHLPMLHMCSSPCLTCAPPHASHVLLPMPHMCSSPCSTLKRSLAYILLIFCLCISYAKLVIRPSQDHFNHKFNSSPVQPFPMLFTALFTLIQILYDTNVFFLNRICFC